MIHVSIRVDDIRSKMSDFELDNLNTICSRPNINVYLAYTPKWLECSGLGDEKKYKQSKVTSSLCLKTLSCIKNLLDRPNTVLGQHGFYHYYKIRELKKWAISGRATRTFIPEWKMIDEISFTRDLEIGAEIIKQIFNDSPKFVSPPSNALSSAARSVCIQKGIKICAAENPYLNILASEMFYRIPFVPLSSILTLYLPIYSEYAVQRLVKRLNNNGRNINKIMLLVHPWELKQASFKSVLNAVQDILGKCA